MGIWAIVLANIIWLGVATQPATGHTDQDWRRPASARAISAWLAVAQELVGMVALIYRARSSWAVLMTGATDVDTG